MSLVRGKQFGYDVSNSKKPTIMWFIMCRYLYGKCYIQQFTNEYL